MQHTFGALMKDDDQGTKTDGVLSHGDNDKDKVRIIPQKGKDQVGLFPPNNHNNNNEHLRQFDVDPSVEEINENGSHQLPD